MSLEILLHLRKEPEMVAGVDLSTYCYYPVQCELDDLENVRSLAWQSLLSEGEVFDI